MKRALFLLPLILCGYLTAQTTHYVDNDPGCPGCNDEAGCGDTIANACDTIEYAYTNRASSGDIISVGDGTYVENSGSNYLAIDLSKNVTIQPTDSPGAVTIKNNGSTQYVVYHTNGNLTLSGITLDGTNVTTTTTGVVHSNASADDLTLTNCTWSNMGAGANCLYTLTGTNGTITIDGCTMTSAGFGVRINNALTSLVMIDTTVDSSSGTTGPIMLGNTGPTTTTLTNCTFTCAATHCLNISCNTTLTATNCAFSTATNGHGVNVDNCNPPSITLINCTGTGGTSSSRDGLHIDSGDSVGTLTITGGTYTGRATSGSGGGIEFAGTVGKAILTGVTIDGSSSNSFGIVGYDGSNYATIGYLRLEECIISASTLNPFYLPKNISGLDIVGCTINGSNSGATCGTVGIETALGAPNANPNGYLRFVGNTCTKAGTIGHNILFGDGCGIGLIADNTFVGGGYGPIFKAHDLEIAYNKVYHTGPHAAFYLSGAKRCFAHNNSVYTTSGHGILFNPNQLPATTENCVVTNNIFFTASASQSAAYFGSLDETSADNCIIDYNLYYAPNNVTNPFIIHNTNYATFAAFKAGWQAKYPGELFGLNDANSRYADPLITNPSTGDFSIPFSSPARGTGFPEYSDIGAYQRRELILPYGPNITR